MKFTFLSVSKIVVWVFQGLFGVIGLLGLFLFLFVKDTSYNFNLGYLEVEKSVELLADNPPLSVTPKEDGYVTPELEIRNVSLDFPTGQSGLKLLMVTLFLLSIGVILFGLEQLKQMILSVEHGNPFIRKNVWRIYILGALICWIPLLETIFRFFSNRWLLNHYDLVGIYLSNNPSNVGFWFLATILLFTIGKIFEQGIRLREEQELTV